MWNLQYETENIYSNEIIKFFQMSIGKLHKIFFRIKKKFSICINPAYSPKGRLLFWLTSFDYHMQ